MSPHLRLVDPPLGVDGRPLTSAEGAELLKLWAAELQRPPLPGYEIPRIWGVVPPCR